MTEQLTALADKIERAEGPATYECGEAGRPLCGACSVPVGELTQQPGCGAPLIKPEGPTKALSIRAPWWWAILHAGKDIENRDWPTKFRGRVYIHASKWWNLQDVTDDTAFVRDAYRMSGGEPRDTGLTYRDMRDAGGHLVGTVEIVDCVERSDSPWFFGRYGFVLRDPKPLASPIPCKGALGFFDPAAALRAEASTPRTAQLRPEYLASMGDLEARN